MISLMTQRLTLSVAALALSMWIATPASAEEASRQTPPAVEAKGDDGDRKFHRRGGMMMADPEEIDKVEKMTREERDAYFQQKREAFEKLSPEEKEAKIKERKEWFKNLSDAEKEKLKERRKAFKDKMRKEFDSLPPEEQAKIKERMKERKEKWKSERAEKFEKMTPKEKEAFKAKQKERFESLPIEKREEMLERFEKSREYRKKD